MKPYSCKRVVCLITCTLSVVVCSCKTSEVTKPASPSAAFLSTNDGCTAPCTVTFTNQSQNADQFAWEFGDGNTAKSMNPTNFYQKGGSYQVTLTASSATGVSTVSQTVSIKSPAGPDVDFDFVNNNCTVACEVRFINKSKNALSYKWEFGDGQTSSEENPNHVFRKSGVFSVKLTAMVPGAVSSSVEKKVIIGEAAVTAVPAFFGFHPFYKKYVDASGIPVISSEKVPDEALLQARKIVSQMVARRPDVVAKMLENKFRLAVMAKTEKTLDIPEHSDLQTAFPQTDWNVRARGLGATLERPAASCAEENLLCYSNDPYVREDITIHEFAHAMHIMGIRYVEKGFDQELETIYNEAKVKGLWKNTYAMDNYSEYFAEGVQDWFNQNDEAIPTNGVHNQINTRAELKEYDPKLYQLISRYFNEDNQTISCHQIR